MIGIIDYGMGNLRSVQKAVAALGGETRILRKPGEAADAARLILPGVGAFGDAMHRIRSCGWQQAICGRAEAGIPVLGICLGMQLLLEESEEYGHHPGLGLIRGRVVPFAGPAMHGLRIPQIGWNNIEPHGRSFLLNLPDPYMYFVHSYHAADVPEENTAAWCTYGIRFVCAIMHRNIWGTQFHPEKSGTAGIEVLRRFLALPDGEVKR